MHDLSRYAAALAAALDIAPPKLARKRPEGMTSTQLGALDPPTRSIWINPAAALPDQLFSLAHEMRHLWQVERCPALLCGYAARSQAALPLYNKQPAEVDAHAFALLIMREWFGSEPLFNGFSPADKQAIYRRAETFATHHYDHQWRGHGENMCVLLSERIEIKEILNHIDGMPRYEPLWERWAGIINDATKLT